MGWFGRASAGGRPSTRGVPPTTQAPNDLWTADFKGHFRTGDGLYCYPLTLADQHTRYLLASQGLARIEGKGARVVLTEAFRTYGLPRAIRTDNGVPFATTPYTEFRPCMSGGCTWGSSTSGFGRPRRRRTGPMSGCTAP